MKKKFVHMAGYAGTRTLCGLPLKSKSVVPDIKDVDCARCRMHHYSDRIENRLREWCCHNEIPPLPLSELPRWCDRLPGNTSTAFDPYFIYHIPEAEASTYLGQWYMPAPNQPIWMRTIVTFKEVTEKSAQHLYGRKYHAVKLFPSGISEGKYKVHVMSPDDACYGMRHDNFTPEVLVEVLEWLHTCTKLCGEEMFKFGKSVGFTKFEDN